MQTIPKDSRQQVLSTRIANRYAGRCRPGVPSSVRRVAMILAVICLQTVPGAAKPPGSAAAAKPRRTPRSTITIVTLGDSITKGVRRGVTAQQTFSARLEKSLRRAGRQVRVVNVGIGGERTDQALKRLKADVIARRPALVTIMYGTNDSYVDRGRTTSRISRQTYRKNLIALVSQLRRAQIVPVLMTEPRWGANAKPNGAGEHPNVRLEKYMLECRAVAKKLRVPLVDHFAVWSRAARKGTDIGGWTTDQCHPNPHGHEVVAKTMLPVLQKVLAGRKRITTDERQQPDPR